jgi:tetratricopeptide (TPR) repeat protein
MTKLSVDQVREAVPDLDELRALLDHVLTRSEPDEAKTWSGSGRLDTVGSRLVSTDGLGASLRGVAAAEARHLDEVYAALADALGHLAVGDRSAAVDALLRVARLEEERDRPARARAYAEVAARVAADGADPVRRALALRRCARAARASGGRAEARTLYREAYELARAAGDARGAAEAAVGAGNVLEEQGQWAEARTWYERALDVLEPLPEPTPERWHALLNLHIVARSTGELDESLEWLERAEAAALLLDPDASAPFVGNARGQLHMAQGAFDDAERELRRALAATRDARATVTIRLNLAETLLARGRTLDATEQARIAEREAIRARLVTKLPEVYRLLGRAAELEGDSSAFVLFERALRIVRERGLPPLEEALTLQAYAEHEARRGESDNALELRRTAARLFEELGIAHPRRVWADVFGPGTHHDSSLAPNEADHED